MRIECLFRGALRMLQKSASRIVASRHLVKKSLRLASILFARSLRRIDSGSPFFTYALSMNYVLGFDGGGTKTECVLMDPAGKILARCFSGPSNPSRVGVESATGEIEKAADLSLQEARVARSAIAALGAGLAGTGKPEMKERMRASLAGAFPGAAVSIFTDLEIALAAAGEGPVIVLVAGTGSAAIGRNAQGQIWRTGGQGPRLGDDSSAFDIGSRSVAPPGRNCNSAPPCSQTTFFRQYFPSWLPRPTPKILQRVRYCFKQQANYPL